MELAGIILLAAAAYVVLGVIFAVLFVTRGVGRVDRVAVGAHWLFRLIILPGAAALWPLMLLKWVKAPAHAHGGEHTR